MCGLVGIAGDTTGFAKDIFTELLIIDSVRGMHSTGVGVVNRWKNEIGMFKRPGPSHMLVIQDEYKKVLQNAAKCIIGHNRHATIGAHTENNAHPFAFDKIIGAHNGTLDLSSQKKLFEYDKFGTDSEAIFANINQFGIEATVEHLSGAWALTWFDLSDNTINFLRNNKRPLYYCYSKDRCSLYWASEIEMLEFALKRHNAMPEKAEFFIVDADMHLQWFVPETVTGKFQPPIKTEMKAPPQPPVTTTYHYGAYGGGWRESDNRSASYGGSTRGSNVVGFQTGGTPSTGGLFNFKADTAKFRPPYKDSHGKIINKKAFHQLTANGCVFCGDNSQDWGDFIKPLKDSDGHQVYLCEDCYNEDEIFEICRNLI